MRDRALSLSAAGVAVGILLSAPVGMGLAALHPQPAWKDAATFFDHFHGIQVVPYAFGFLLVAGCVAFVVRAALLDWPAFRATCALVALAAFAALICLNYTLQTGFVAHAARLRDPAAAAITMTNPGSIGWTLEMYGYGLFGAATWLIAPSLRPGPRGRVIAPLLVANGVVSIAAAVATGLDLAWVLTLPGLVGFVAWNVLLFGTMVLVAVAWWPRAQDLRRRGPAGALLAPE